MFEYTCSFTAIIGLMIGGLLPVKYFLKKLDSSIPIFVFPSDKRKNFYIIQKSRFDPLKRITQSKNPGLVGFFVRLIQNTDLGVFNHVT